MIQQLLTYLLVSTCLALSMTAHAEKPSLDYQHFASTPILHNGRVQPLDSVARSYLIAFSGRQSIEELHATAWLAELLFTPKRAVRRPIFNIPNPEVTDAIGLTWDTTHRYTFKETIIALGAHNELLTKLSLMTPEARTLAQQQLLELYDKTRWYIDLTRTLSLIRTSFSVPDATRAETLQLTPNEPFSYLDMIQRKQQFLEVTENIIKKPEGTTTVADNAYLTLILGFKELSGDKEVLLFPMIPPQGTSTDWLPAWMALEPEHISPERVTYLRKWQDVGGSYAKEDIAAWNQATQELYKTAYQLADDHANPSLQSLETFYNQTDLFYVSLALYLFTLIIGMFAHIAWHHPLRKIAIGTFTAGMCIHIIGLILRCLIMSRPPVTTLYESIIFVAAIIALASLIIEYYRKDTLGILTGAFVTSILQFISTRYAAEGNTMEVLVAVLNTNFWLSTHVVTITIGYGFCLIAGTLAHVYLLQAWLKKDDKMALKHLQNTILAVSLVALFFSLVGTILGGIWADQSWGRFWGWDPKENGALLIVLWLVWLLHGRIAGMLKPHSFAAGMAVTNIIVALAWFGVNLLNVGLHSYGFIDHIATNLAIFCGIEIVFILCMYGTISYQQQKITSTPMK